MSDATLPEVFKSYASFGRPDQDKDITSKNFAKLIKEKGLMDKKLNSTEVDMVFTIAKGGAGIKTLTYAKFQTALSLCGKAKYGSVSEENTKKITDKLLIGGGPSTAGTTGVSTTGGVKKMTDASKYTGSHKERFDAETGKGKGLEGRKDMTENKGYVGAYKGEGTFGQKK